MEITLIGYVLLPLGICLAVLRPAWLLSATVFFVPFSATALINVRQGAASFGLQPFHYFGALLLATKIRELMAGKLSLVKEQADVLVALVMFWCAVLLSLCINLLSGQALIAFNITQLLYLLSGISITIAVILDTNADKLQSLVNWYIWSGVFISFWGLFELACYRFGVPYPSFLFNNSVSKATQGFTAVLSAIGAKRISSVAVEPSILARVLVSDVAILLSRISRRRLDWVSLLQVTIVLVTLLLSTSTTAYLGLLFVLVVATVVYWRKSWKIAATLMPIFIGALLLLSFNPRLWDAASFLTVDKMDSGSYQERADSVTTALHAFSESPIIGAGWGNVQSHDLIVNLLANSGLIGLLCFLWFLVIMFRRTHLRRGNQLSVANLADAYNKMWIVDGLQLGLASILLADASAGFGYVFGHFWCLSGLLIGSIRLKTEFKPKPKDTPNQAAAQCR